MTTELEQQLKDQQEHLKRLEATREAAQSAWEPLKPAYREKEEAVRTTLRACIEAENDLKALEALIQASKHTVQVREVVPVEDEYAITFQYTDKVQQPAILEMLRGRFIPVRGDTGSGRILVEGFYDQDDFIEPSDGWVVVDPHDRTVYTYRTEEKMLEEWKDRQNGS